MTRRMRSNLQPVPQHLLGAQRGVWSVIIPEGTTNLVANPSVELNANGYNGAYSDTFARVNDDAAFGAWSLRTTSTQPFRGWSYTVTTVTTTDIIYTASVWVRGRGRIFIAAYGPVSIYIAPKTHMLTNTWQRISTTFMYRSADVTRFIRVEQEGAGTAEWYSDGLQLEAKPYMTTYCDGNQEDCTWLAAVNASQSRRGGSTRKGGRHWNFADWKFRVNGIIGADAASLNTITTEYALTGGGYYQRSVAPPRAFSIVGGFECDSDIDLKRNRLAMLNALSPFTFDPPQPARLIYEPTDCLDVVGKRIVIDAVYTGGLEGNNTNDLGREDHALAFQVQESFGILGRSDHDVAQPLVVSQYVYGLGNIRRSKLDGSFANMFGLFASGVVDARGVFAAAIRENNLYVGGRGIADGIVQWDGSAWSSIGVFDDPARECTAMVVNYNGWLIAAGNWLTIGGVSLPGIAAWAGLGWFGVGGFTGLSGGLATIFAMAVTPNGDLFVGGNFTTIQGVAALNIAHLPFGGSWQAMGAGANGDVLTIDVDSAGNVYFGGAFTSIGGVAASRFAVRNAVTGVFTQVNPAQPNSLVTVMRFGYDGRLHIGGDFTAIGAFPISRYAVNSGIASQWDYSNLNQFDDYIAGMDPKQLGGMHFGGFFDTIFTNGVGAEFLRAAKLKGNAFFRSDFVHVLNPGANMNPRVFREDASYEYYLGGFVENIEAAALTTIINNDAAVTPTLIITGSGTLHNLMNWTTGKEIGFTCTVLTNEILTLVMGSQWTFTSNLRGDMSTYIVPTSDVATWQLQPGINHINFLMSNNSGGTATLLWRAQYTSLDAAAGL